MKRFESEVYLVVNHPTRCLPVLGAPAATLNDVDESLEHMLQIRVRPKHVLDPSIHVMRNEQVAVTASTLGRCLIEHGLEVLKGERQLGWWSPSGGVIE